MLRAAVAAVAVGLALVGCGGGPDYSLSGRWQGVVVLGAWEGQELIQTFNDGGDYRLFVGSAQFVGTWSSPSSDVVTIADGSCQTTDPGTFQLKWVDAQTFVYHTIDDACPSRGDTLNGVTMTQPYR